MAYNSQRTKNLFLPGREKPFKLSRSKIQGFLDCPRCFLSRSTMRNQTSLRLFPFTLNSAVDTLLKREFDQYREDGKPHPLIIKYGIDAVPFSHPELEDMEAKFQRHCKYFIADELHYHRSHRRSVDQFKGRADCCGLQGYQYHQRNHPR